MKKKRCSACKRLRKIVMFNRFKGNKVDGFYNKCRQCQQEDRIAKLKGEAPLRPDQRRRVGHPVKFVAPKPPRVLLTEEERRRVEKEYQRQYYIKNKKRLTKYKKDHKKKEQEARYEKERETQGLEDA